MLFRRTGSTAVSYCGMWAALRSATGMDGKSAHFGTHVCVASARAIVRTTGLHDA
jgi:hypothetical protein